MMIKYKIKCQMKSYMETLEFFFMKKSVIIKFLDINMEIDFLRDREA